jgi:hypothetical protein
VIECEEPQHSSKYGTGNKEMAQSVDMVTHQVTARDEDNEQGMNIKLTSIFKKMHQNSFALCQNIFKFHSLDDMCRWQKS